MKKIAVIILTVVVFAPVLHVAPVSIRYFQTDQRYLYRVELLKLALEKTLETDGPYILKPVDEEMTQARGLSYLQKGQTVDIAFLPTTAERERQFLPIKIPILRGILGYRVLLIHKDDAVKFSTIETFEQLKAGYTAGFGADWADLTILKQNGISVDETVKYELLFAKLEKKRFDYFPRGINEAWQEIHTFSSTCPNLMVDSHLALYYPYPVYFFANAHNVQLAERIERGLTIALNDGSFKELFLTYHKDLIEQAGLAHRKLFRLENPTLPAGTPEPDTSWWLETP